MKKIINLIMFLVFVWCVISSVRPYWYRYWSEKDLEAVAVYGTKHSLRETRKFLNKKMKDQDRDFKREDFIIEKDENNTVRVSITYNDKISIFIHKIDIY